jgi:hypothetical protein
VGRAVQAADSPDGAPLASGRMSESKVDVVGHLDALQERPLPAKSTRWEHGGVTVLSEPQGSTAVLAESPPFWDDPDGSRSVEAAPAMAALLDGYVATVRAVWGEPAKIDVRPELAAGRPSPLARLLMEHGTTGARGWDREHHRVALTDAQVDKEFPIQVVALVVPRTAT